MTKPFEAAFARPVGSIGPEESNEDQKGLTKREYFAAQAMRGAIEWHGYHEDPSKTKCANIAKDCVSMADALIAELNK